MSHKEEIRRIELLQENIPQEFLNMANEAEKFAEIFHWSIFEELKIRGKKFGIEVVQLSAPVHLDCNHNEPHRVASAVPLEPDRIDEWLEKNVGTRLPILRASKMLLNKNGDYVIGLRICECLEPPHPLIQLARQAE